MRINIYSQEIGGDADLVTKVGADGSTYSAIQFELRSEEFLHEDDKSAVTFWLPSSTSRREMLAKTFEHAAKLVRSARPEK